VAIVGRGVVAHGKDGKVVYDKAQKKFPDQRVLVAQVPLREAMVLWLVCFPFLKQKSEALGMVVRPFAKITLKSSTGKSFDIVALVDSGADVSLFSRSVARILGIAVRRGKPKVFHGLGGGQVEAYIHRIDLELGGIRLKARVAFPEVEVPNILDRLDILKNSSWRFRDEEEVCFEF